jgi:thiol-disulfide isomerase/thioredoxin
MARILRKRMVAASILATMAMVSKTAVVAFRPSLGQTMSSPMSAAANRNLCGLTAWCDPMVASVSAARGSSRMFASVTGSVYNANISSSSSSSSSKVVVTLYTKEGCTLCDKVKDVLQEIRQEGENDSESEQFAHSLRQIDITDDDQQDSYDRYKYDIPVLHIGYTNGDNDENDSVYWTKHRLTKEEAKTAIGEAMGGSFEPRQGQPNATAMER